MTRFSFIVLTCCLFATPASAQLVVNEYSCANWRNILDYYDETEDWVELFNQGTAAVNLTGYHLSDDETEPLKWTFPANVSIEPGGLLRVWCSGRSVKDPQGNLHTSFRLSQTKNNPEHIVFSSASGAILEDIEIVKTQVHQSRGRFPNGSSNWYIFTEPTPGVLNTNSGYAIGYAPRPSFSLPAGFYPGPVTISITISDPSARVYYTTDGTEPDNTSPQYGGPVSISHTTVLKAVAYSQNNLLLPGFTQFSTYFINEQHTLPVVSVAGNQLLDLANGDQSLRPVGSLEYFNKAGARKARAYGELNSHGQDSWANDQRSLDWVTRDEMGHDYAVREKLFSFTDRDEFQRIILRAAGDDNYPAAHKPQNEGSAHVRDAYIHNLAKRGGLNLDMRVSEKCIIYLNGEYWGVYDLREIPDDHDYTEYYYDQGKYDLQYVLTWGNTWAEYGGQQAISAWNSMRSYILNNNMNDPVKFKYVTDRYDYKSLVDYVVVNSFTVCSDWLNWNTGLWRGLNPAGGHRKWGYILWDNDATFDHYINYTNVPSTQPDALPCNPESLNSWSDPEQHIQVLNKLRTNPEVKQYYLARQADLMQTVFGCENMLTYLDSIEATIDPEMARHAERWYGTYDEWKNNLQELRDFITARCNLLPSLMDDCYSMTGPYATTILVDPPGIAGMQVNTLYYGADQVPVNGQYFGGADIDLQLRPVWDTTQYRFSYWSAGHLTFQDSSKVFVSLDPVAPDTIVAHFTPVSSSVSIPGNDSYSAEIIPTVFSDELTILYSVPERTDVALALFDITGKAVWFNRTGKEASSPGKNVVKVNIGDQNIVSGVYFMTFTADNFRKTFRLVKI